MVPLCRQRIIHSTALPTSSYGHPHHTQEKGKKQPFYIHLAPKNGGSGGSGGAGARAAGGGTAGGAAGGEAAKAVEEEDAAAASATGDNQAEGEEEPLVFAGLYDVWQGAEGHMHTYTILTTGAAQGLPACSLEAAVLLAGL